MGNEETEEENKCFGADWCRGKQNKFVRSQYSSYLVAVVLDLGSRHKHSCLKEISHVTSVPPCSGSSPLGTLGID